MAKIYDPRNEPQTYQERRLVLEGLRDLRMNYYMGDLEITGSVPVAAAPSSSEKNCHSSLYPHAERNRRYRDRGENAGLPQHQQSEVSVPQELIDSAHVRSPPSNCRRIPLQGTWRVTMGTRLATGD